MSNVVKIPLLHPINYLRFPKSERERERERENSPRDSWRNYRLAQGNERPRYPNYRLRVPGIADEQRMQNAKSNDQHIKLYRGIAAI
jgi:hypothetical protein